MKREFVRAGVLSITVFFLAVCTNPTSDDSSSTVSNVTSLQAGLADGEVVLSWTDPDDSTFSKVEISGDGFSTTTVNKGVQTATITGLTNGTAYTFAVKSVDTSGGKNSGTNITATPFENVPDVYLVYGNAAITLRYGPPKASGYSKVEISGTDITSFTVDADSATWSSTPVTDLTIGKSYTFTIKVVDAAGNKQTEGVSITGIPGLWLSYSNGNPVDGATVTEGGVWMPTYVLIGEDPATADWESANTNVATVDSSGLVTGVSAGVTSITATSGIYTVTFGVSVWEAGTNTYTFSTTVGDPDPIYNYNQLWGMQVSSSTSFPVSVSAVKTSGSDLSHTCFEFRKTVGSSTVRYQFEIRPKGEYRIRRQVDTLKTVIVPWTSHSSINAGLNVSNTVEVTQEIAGVLGLVINGTSITSVTDPDSVDYSGGIFQVRQGLLTSYYEDYSVIGAETVTFTY